jgi:Fe2+ transport system protein FeoA
MSHNVTEELGRLVQETQGADPKADPFDIRKRLLELGITTEALQRVVPEAAQGVELWVDFAYEAAEREDWLAAKRCCQKALEELNGGDPERRKRVAKEREQRARLREEQAPVTVHADGVRRPQKAKRHRDPLSIDW